MKILILTASVGSGHVRAAQALEAALRETRPEVTTRVVDVLEHAHPAFRAVYGRGYLALAAQAPHLVGWLFDRTDRSGAGPADRLRLRLQRLALGRFEKLLAEERWDLAVSTHFLAPELIAALRRAGRLALPQAVVVTDFDAHRIWAHDPCELFLAASPEAAASLQRHGAPAGRVAVTGIPIHPRFARLPTRARARRTLGLDAAEPVVLLLGGGCGMGPLEALYESLESVRRPLQIVAVAGRNDALRARLAMRAAAGRHLARVLGYTERIDELMAAADVVVTKPGGLTVAEALACGTPLILAEPIPGQESRNADHALENGAALKLNHPAALKTKLEALLDAPERLEAMKAAARRLGCPVSAFDAARLLVESAQAERRQHPSERGEQDSEGDEGGGVSLHGQSPGARMSRLL